MKNVNGKLVLITGGAMGIGRLMAKKFAEEKARVVIWDIKQDALNSTVSELKSMGCEAYGFMADVSKREMVYEVADKTKAEAGKVDVLVNNAGVVFKGNILDMPDDKIEATFAINLLAYAWTMKAFLPDMMAKKEGHVINVASASGFIGVPGLAAYASSKHGVIGLSESVRLEMRKMNYDNIHFTTVCPSYIQTGMFEGVKPPLFTPWLTPEQIVDAIYNAFKRNQSLVREPFMVKFTPALKGILPTPVFDVVGDVLGLMKGMDEFKGH